MPSLASLIPHKKNKAVEINLDKKRAKGIFAVYRLFNRYYIKSFFGPFYSFVFPVLIYSILGTLMNAKLLFPGMIAMTALSTGLQSMPAAILDLKKSVLLKRIGASPVKPSTFTLAIVTYYMAIISLSILWLMMWALIMFKDQSVFDPLKTVIGAMGFLYGNLMNIAVSIAVGFAIATIGKSSLQVQTIGMLIYFPATFLSGHFVSVDLIAKSEVMNWISRFIPFRYTTMTIVESWNGTSDFRDIIGGMHTTTSNPFIIHDYEIFRVPKIDWTVGRNPDSSIKELVQPYVPTIVIYDKADHICGYAIPLTMLFGLGIFSIEKFSWSSVR